MDASLAEAYKMPEGKNPALLQFNKITGALVGVLSYVDPETLNQEFFDYVKVDDFDFENDEVKGTYSDYQIVDVRTQPSAMYEEALDALARDKITKRYPVIKQVNILGNAILKLSEALGIDQPELLEMRAYITEIKRINALHKTYYAESPDYEYISIEENQARQADQMEGGLHEAYGPRVAAGGSVF